VPYGTFSVQNVVTIVPSFELVVEHSFVKFVFHHIYLRNRKKILKIGKIMKKQLVLGMQQKRR
jgi:hypothetical protein